MAKSSKASYKNMILSNYLRCTKKSILWKKPFATGRL